jgi:hypothetical protein
MTATDTSATISTRHEIRCARPGRPERVFCPAMVAAPPEPAGDRTRPRPRRALRRAAAEHSERSVTPPIHYAGLRRVGHEISEETPAAVAELALDDIARAA